MTRRIRPPSPARRCGYTLIEVLVSSAAASVLMAGLGASIFVASQAFDQVPSSPQELVEADEALAQLLRDAQVATTVSELTSTAATFTVPDRNGDNIEETIRYAWSGTPGDPLTYQYNGAVVAVLMENVQNFEMTYVSRFMEGRDQSLTVLYVSAQKDPSTHEEAEIKQLKAWEYEVVQIASTEDKSAITAAAGKVDVVFVSSAASSDVGSPLASVTVGVVSCQYPICTSLGFSKSYKSDQSKVVRVMDSSHAITEGYPENEDLVLMKTELVINSLDSWSDAVLFLTRSDSGNQPALCALEKGATSVSGTPVSGRRVMLPWGGSFSYLNNDGMTLMQRSIEWAAESPAASGQENAFGWGTTFLK